MPVDNDIHHAMNEARGARRRGVCVSVLVVVLSAAAAIVPIDVAMTAARADGTSSAGAAADALPADQVGFNEDYLNEPANIEAGEAVWKKQCRHCHGKAAYPGKAPKLKPGKYTAEFVYDRVTFGFRKMPAWKDVFSLEERKAVAAYVLSDDFSP